MSDMLNSAAKYLPIAALAAFGGLVRCLSAPRRLSRKMVVCEIIIAVFAGVLVSLLLAPFGLSQQVSAAAAALAGYSSKAVLYIIEQAFLRKVKKGAEDDSV
ncbi:MAG: LydA holin phage, holin superfamily [Verrucomicrobiota bacterium]|jgi:hypothetical protein